MIKKILFTLIVFSSLSAGYSVFAETEDIIKLYPSGIEFSGTEIGIEPEKENVISLFSTDDYNDLYNYLQQQCMAHSTEIDISSYKIPSSQIFDIYCSFAQQHPELLIKTKLQWTASAILKNTQKIYPEYLFESVEQDNEARELMNEKLLEYVNLAKSHSGNIEKLLFIHDKMVAECEYDTDYSSQAYHAYGFFNNNKAVCQGYAQAFYMIASELGFDVDFCASESINHIWNYIKIDNKWYHIDTTWDDPVVKNSNGEIVHRTTAYHDNFLVTDNTIEASHSQKSDWESYINDSLDCVDNNYEHGFIFNVPSPFTIISLNNKLAFYKSIGEYKALFSSDNAECGAILNSEIIDNNGQGTIYYYCLEEINEIISVNTCVYEDNTLIKANISEKGTPQFAELCKHSFTKPNSNQSIKLFIWNMKSLVPYSKAISVSNDNF